jgi:hypothetical protein
MQVNFTHPEDRLEALRRLHDIRSAAPGSLSQIARSVHLLDDSEPREGRFKAFVVPRWASKARAAHNIFQQLCAGSVAATDLNVLFVGDSYPDLHMGLVGGAGIHATLLLVGRSRLMDVLWEPDTAEFAGESLRSVKRRLRRTDRPGYLRYRAPCRGDGELTVILGDVAFPESVAVETVERYLESSGR